ncbi:YjjG family noncanonical pyrimidine nucleotidase [Levilactobacillus yonginensis]
MLKYAIFDLDDTLLDFTRGENEGITHLLKKYGVTDIQAGFKTYLNINHAVWQAIEQGAPREQLLNERFTRTFAAMGLAVDGATVEEQYNVILDHNYYILAGADSLLQTLRAAGMTLVVATNGTKSIQLNRLNGSGLRQHFDSLFISEDIGYTKPDSRFFAPIFRHYPDLTSANTLMIGDRLQSDILGARNAQLHNVWFNPQHHVNQLDFQPTYEVTSYRDLQQLLLAEV